MFPLSFLPREMIRYIGRINRLHHFRRCFSSDSDTTKSGFFSDRIPWEAEVDRYTTESTTTSVTSVGDKDATATKTTPQHEWIIPKIPAHAISVDYSSPKDLNHTLKSFVSMVRRQ